MNDIVFSILLIIVGLGAGIGITFIVNLFKENTTSKKIEKLLSQAKKVADKLKRDAILEQKEEQHRLKMELDKEIKEKKEAFSAAYGKMTLGLLGVKEVMESDLEFHNAIARATGNRLFTEFLDAVRATVSKSYLKSRGEALTDPYRDSSLESALSAHERIVAAIEAQDPELAHRCMSEHVTQIMSSLKQSEEEKL